MQRWLIVVAAMLLGIATGAGATESLAQTYPGPWHREFNKPIVVALSVHHVRNCGDIAYRPNPKQRGEYLVYCSNDDGIWAVYLVWTGINKIMGPYPVDPSVPAPDPIIDLR